MTYINLLFIFRMKMENLHKCEQVLVNLYAKVESQVSLYLLILVKERYLKK